MNFTAAAILLSFLLISAYAVAITPPFIKLGYTSLRKVKAEDYAAAANALAYASRGEDPSNVLPNYCWIEYVILEGWEKHIVVVCDHSWVRTENTVYLRAEVVGVSDTYPCKAYKVKVESDRPVIISFNTTAYYENGVWIVHGNFMVTDNRGLVVEGGG